MAAKSVSPASVQILSEIGLIDIPDDWTIVRIEDLLHNERGISVGVMYPGEHDPDGIPLIKAGDLSGNRINPNPEFRITPNKHFEYRRTALAGGELLISLVGDVGRCALVPPSMAGWNTARAVAVLRFHNRADAAFVRGCLMSPSFQHLMQAWSTTTVQATLNLKEIRQIPLPWPPTKQRDAIAHILGTLDDKIELNRRRNETLEAMARALFKSWFVDFEPVRAKLEDRWQRGLSLPGLPAHLYDLFPDRLVESELGEIPEGWEMRSLDSIANYLNGLSLQKFPPESDDEFLPVIKIAQLRAGNTNGADRASARIKPEYVVVDGDVLFSWSGSLEVEVWNGGRGALNQHLFKVTSDMVPKWFYFFATRHHLQNFRAIAADKATTMGHIQRKHLTDARIAVASPESMKAFDIALAPLFDQMVSNAQQSRSLAQLRDTLLPKLISGGLRVRNSGFASIPRSNS